MNALAANAFDYRQLDAATAAAARQDAELIRDRLRRSVEDIVAIGKALARQKAKLGHGRFLAWIEAEVEMSDQTARRFMHVAERYGAKSNIVLNLRPTVLFALAAPSTPESVREEVEALAASGESVTMTDVRRVRRQHAPQEPPALPVPAKAVAPVPAPPPATERSNVQPSTKSPDAETVIRSACRLIEPLMVRGPKTVAANTFLPDSTEVFEIRRVGRWLVDFADAVAAEIDAATTRRPGELLL